MKQVLIVDDNILDNKAVRLALSGRYFTSSVTSGTDVFMYLNQHRPDIILLDQFMPDMTGFDVIKKLKADAALANIPVMFLTADDSGEVESNCFRLGAVDCIHKPANRDMLLQRLNSRLREAESRDSKPEYGS